MVCRSYCDVYMSLEMRQRELQSTFNIKCACERCQYPVTEEQDIESYICQEGTCLGSINNFALNEKIVVCNACKVGHSRKLYMDAFETLLQVHRVRDIM